MMQPRTGWILALGLCAGISYAHGQSVVGHSLWRVYFLAGESAAKEKNWPEAESLYSAAIKQAEADTPSEPFLKMSRYSLGTAYFEEGRQDDAAKIFNAMDPILDPALATPETRDLADVFESLGNSFYSEGEDETQAASDKKLKDDDLNKANASAHWKYLFARRYFQWALVIDSHFFDPHSPELQTIVGNLALADYRIGVYDDAIENFLQLRQIIDTSMQRDNALSRGSLAYSLASKTTTAEAKNSLSIAAIDFYTGLSYEGEGDEVVREKPAEAAQKYGQAEIHLTEGAKDNGWRKVILIVLARIYKEHAEVLRNLKQDAEAERLDHLALKLQPPSS